MTDTTQLLASLELLTAAFERLVAPLSPAQLHMAAGGDEDWQIIEVVGHVRDAVTIYAERIRKVATEDNPQIAAFDQDAYVRQHNYRAQDDAAPLLGEIIDADVRTLLLLTDAPPQMWTRTGVHSERGPMTLRDFVATTVGHEATHYNQIARMVAPDAIAAVAMIPERVAAAIAGVAETRLAARSAGEGEWNIREVIGHLGDMPALYIQRADQIAAEAWPHYARIDQEALVRDGGYAEQESAALMTRLRDGHAALVEKLAAVQGDVWARPGTHPTRGPITFYDLVKAIVDHADNHLRQIAALLTIQELAAKG